MGLCRPRSTITPFDKGIRAPNHWAPAPRFSIRHIGVFDSSRQPWAASTVSTIHERHSPDLQLVTEQEIVGGDVVVVRWTRGCTVLQFRNGKIVHSFGYWDNACMFQQLGVSPETARHRPMHRRRTQAEGQVTKCSSSSVGDRGWRSPATLCC